MSNEDDCIPIAQEWDKLWALNKKIIDPVCPRHTAVAAEGRVRMRLNNGPEQPEVVSVPKHKKHPPAGVKATTRTKACTPLPVAQALLGFRLEGIPNTTSPNKCMPGKLNPLLCKCVLCMLLRGLHTLSVRECHLLFMDKQLALLHSVSAAVLALLLAWLLPHT